MFKRIFEYFPTNIDIDIRFLVILKGKHCTMSSGWVLPCWVWKWYSKILSYKVCTSLLCCYMEVPYQWFSILNWNFCSGLWVPKYMQTMLCLLSSPQPPRESIQGAMKHEVLELCLVHLVYNWVEKCKIKIFAGKNFKK